MLQEKGDQDKDDVGAGINRQPWMGALLAILRKMGGMSPQGAI